MENYLHSCLESAVKMNLSNSFYHEHETNCSDIEWRCKRTWRTWLWRRQSGRSSRARREALTRLSDWCSTFQLKQNSVGSRYPEFRITRPQIVCFVNWTNSIRNIGGLVIWIIKAIPVFVRITRPMIFFLLKKVLWSWSIGIYIIIWRVSLSGQIMVNPDKFRITRRVSLSGSG